LLHLLTAAIGTKRQLPRIYEAGPLLLWGGFCQGGAPRVLSIFSSFSFFVRPGSRFFAPTHTPSGRRAQERSRLAVHRAATDRLGLDGSEHDGILVVVGMTTSEGSSHVVHEHSRHILLFGGADPDHDAVMRIGSESSEAADPFWGTAFEAMQRTGTPPPRTVIGDPSRACRQGRNRRVFCDRVPPFSVRDGGRRPRARRRRARGATRR
jgi:hypothetical protein